MRFRPLAVVALLTIISSGCSMTPLLEAMLGTRPPNRMIPGQLFRTGGGIHSTPIAFSVDGKESIAVPSGWDGWVEGIAPQMASAPRGDALDVFSLP